MPVFGHKEENMLHCSHKRAVAVLRVAHESFWTGKLLLSREHYYRIESIQCSTAGEEHNISAISFSSIVYEISEVEILLSIPETMWEMTYGVDKLMGTVGNFITP